MKIEIIHADGTRTEAQSPLNLQPGDTLIIDGKISDMQDLIVNDNQIIITINGKPFIINNTDLFIDNKEDYDNMEDLLSDTSGTHTAIVFDEDGDIDCIIDDIKGLADLMQTEAGEDEGPKSDTYSPEFLERENKDTNIEATLRDTSRDIEGKLEEIERDRADDALNYTTKKKEVLSEQGGLPKDNSDDGIVENQETGGDYAELDTIEDSTQDLSETQDEETQDDNTEENVGEQDDETTEPIQDNDSEETTNEPEVIETEDGTETEPAQDDDEETEGDLDGVDEINLGDNKLSNLNMEDIMDLSSGETLTFTGTDGSEIDFSTLPEGETVQKIGTIQIQDETYDTYSYSDSLGQELQMMIDNQIQVDL